MSKEDTKWRLRDSEGKEYIIIDSEKVDLQEELNKTIEKLIEKNKQLHSIIKEAREYMKTLSDEYAKDDYDIKCDVFNKLYYQILDKENI